MTLGQRLIGELCWLSFLFFPLRLVAQPPAIEKLSVFLGLAHSTSRCLWVPPALHACSSSALLRGPTQKEELE